MRIEPQSIPEILLVTPTKLGDDRGYFAELYREALLGDYGVAAMVQHNFSRSSKGVLRGLHYQLSSAPLGKLIHCLAGRIFDVAVDIRRGSPSYGEWFGIELAPESMCALYVPEGFAHGFCALTDIADVFYSQTGYHAPEFERGIRWNDPTLDIQWPTEHPKLSAKDAAAPGLADADNDFDYRRTSSL